MLGEFDPYGPRSVPWSSLWVDAERRLLIESTAVRANGRSAPVVSAAQQRGPPTVLALLSNQEISPVSKRTFQPNNRRRAKTHGFRLRMRTRAGRAIVSARRRKGRSELSA